MKSRHHPRVTCLLRVEELETRLTPAPVVLQPDLQITNIGTASDGPPAQMVFGPDGRLYMTLANFSGPNAASVESFAYSPSGGLSDERTEVSTGGALGIGFGPVSLGVYGQPGVQTVTGMYLTDTARTINGNDVSNLRVLTQDQNGVWGGPNGGTDTIIVKNIPAGWHQADQIIIKQNADGTSTLYVGIGVRTKDGALDYPNPSNARDMAYGGTISEILDLKQVNGLVTDSAGFGLTGVATSNSDPDYSNAGPYTSTAVNKLIIQSSGTRNPFGLALDGSGNLWFTNNFNRSQSDGTFNGTIDPSTGLLYGITTGDPAPGPDLANNAYDQFFEDAPLADYGYNNSNWRNDAADDNPSVTSEAAVNAGFFNFAEHGVRSTTFDNLVAPPGGFAEYNESDINQIQGLGPSASADGVAFYTGTTFPATYQGDAFIARFNSTVSDSTGHSITYNDLVTVDPTTGNVRIIADNFDNPLAVLYDGSGNMIIADYGDSAIYRLSSTPTPTSLVVSGFPLTTEAGSAQTITVAAFGPSGSGIDAGYTGTVQFTSSDPIAVLPSPYTFTAADGGVHTFTVILNTPGIQSISVSDPVNGLSGMQSSISVQSGVATFVGQDTKTEGNWIGVYGNDGYDLAGSGVINPAQATFTLAGQAFYRWPTPPLSAKQALEVPPSGTSRIAAAWYSPTSFTIDVNVAAGQSYNLELYFLDYDSRGRAETVSLTDATTNTVLNSQSVSNFASGEYLIWTISGNVLITFTRTAGVNAVLSGLFFDPVNSPPPPPPPPGATASFVGSDSLTQGNWIGVYGNDGYDLAGSGVINPAQATFTLAGQAFYSWPTPPLSAKQALEVPPSGTSRIAAAWYSPTSFTIDVNVAAGQSYNLELYFLDYDSRGRAETVSLTDATTNTVLNSQSVSNFASGEYLIWTISGNVLITFTRTAGVNAVLSGLFFDPVNSPPPPPPPPGATASFVGSDSLTQGNWIGVYGNDGYDLAGSGVINPAQATFTLAGQAFYRWPTPPLSAKQALEVPPSGTSRIAAAWYSPTSFTIDVNVAAGQSYNLELYFLDYDSRGRGDRLAHRRHDEHGVEQPERVQFRERRVPDLDHFRERADHVHAHRGCERLGRRSVLRSRLCFRGQRDGGRLSGWRNTCARRRLESPESLRDQSYRCSLAIETDVVVAGCQPPRGGRRRAIRRHGTQA